MPQEITVQVDGYDDVVVSRANEDDTINLTVSDADVLVDGNIELSLFESERDRLVEALQNIDGVVEQPEVIPTRVSSVRVAESQAQAFLAAKVPMLIDYTKESGERITRVVSPYEIKSIVDSGSALVPPKYVVGWDHDAEGIRNFRLARIKGIAPAPVEYRTPA